MTYALTFVRIAYMALERKYQLIIPKEKLGCYLTTITIKHHENGANYFHLIIKGQLTT